MARKLRVWVDQQACVGNAMCEAIAPKVFRLNDNRQSEVTDPAGESEAEDPGGGGELPGQRDLRGGCGDRRATVPIAVQAIAQSSVFRPGTRVNPRVLAVTNTALRRRAWPAMSTS